MPVDAASSPDQGHAGRGWLQNVDASLAFGPDGELLPITKMPWGVRCAIAELIIEERRHGDGAVSTKTVRIKLYDGRTLRSGQKPPPIPASTRRRHQKFMQSFEKDSPQ